MSRSWNTFFEDGRQKTRRSSSWSPLPTPRCVKVGTLMEALLRSSIEGVLGGGIPNHVGTFIHAYWGPAAVTVMRWRLFRCS